MTNAGYRVITAEDAEQRFSVSDEVEYPFADFNDEQEIRLYEGDLRIEGDFDNDSGDDWCPYNTIVDGDLVVDGDLDWSDSASGNFLLVTGDLRARNVLLGGCPNVVVRGDLIVERGVQGHHGDDGGLLVVNGQTTANIIVSTLYFCMSFARQPEAILVGDTYRTTCPVDFSDDELADIVLPELLKDGRADEHRIADALREGRPILRPTAVPSRLATLAELDLLLADAERVTKLDLTDRKLRAFPEQLFAFPNLRKLSLAGNDLIGELPERFGELASLEELDLSKMRLSQLPASIGRLRRLRILNLSYNDFTALPEEIGDLASLRWLRAWNLTCPLPDALARLSELEELDLYSLEPPRRDGEQVPLGHLVEFPLVVTRLAGLRKLDLSMTRLDGLPDDLLRLTALEELRLNGALGFVDRLPDLTELPRLRVLHLDGRSANAGRHPDPRLLDAVWPITTLEELHIDRWGEQTRYHPGTKRHEVVRPGTSALPDDAFARMPRLCRLDLSFNELTSLPESFYALTALAEVDLQYTKLDAATLDRLRGSFPQTRLDLRNVAAATDDVDDPGWRQVHELVAQGGKALRADRADAVRLFEQALTLCVPGARFAEYDQLYALYGLVDALGHLRRDADGPERDALTRQLAGHAEQALSLVPPTIWHYTELGAFQEEVTRKAGNALAWVLMERGELDRALELVDRALTAADGDNHDYVRDTKVRILLAAGRADEAYLIVDQVLARDPAFADFLDLRESAGFRAWRREHS